MFIAIGIILGWALLTTMVIGLARSAALGDRPAAGAALQSGGTVPLTPPEETRVIFNA